MRQLGKKRSRIGGEAGSTIVEMALILPLFLLLVFGIFEFGRAWLIINTLNHAAREAVRLASVTPNLTTNNGAVITKATTILTSAGIAGATVTNTAATGTPLETTVNIALTYTWLTGIGPLLGFSFAGTIPLSSSATMRYEL
ncbi:TadE-like protein [Candidatus Methylomirabilis lanthanidiphila]|uniref:TadE-like protein n=1 Tax=Candidatus Methylomirabilis lanthanidiphila TaxID=2211376 RepID=A0A564ZGE9_9BACT|nr:pilus assembly protein [Candidatus Methylomirabilis lanthanidiphila]VUZ84374.1 TadE-like protein [Candidatus Methylomirabilis lanthanidiphila]